MGWPEVRVMSLPYREVQLRVLDRVRIYFAEIASLQCRSPFPRNVFSSYLCVKFIIKLTLMTIRFLMNYVPYHCEADWV